MHSCAMGMPPTASRSIAVTPAGVAAARCRREEMRCHRVDDRQHETLLRHLDERCPLGVTESDGVEGSGFDVLRFFLDTGIVPSLLECESKERSLPKDRLCLYYQLWRSPFTTFPLHNFRYGIDRCLLLAGTCVGPSNGRSTHPCSQPQSPGQLAREYRTAPRSPTLPPGGAHTFSAGA